MKPWMEIKLQKNSQLNEKVFSTLVILVFTVASLLLNHYKYGVGDQIIHIPFIKDLLDPTLYPNDILVENMYKKPTYFWLVFLPIFKLIGLEKGMLVLQFLSLYIFFMVIKKFVLHVTKSEAASYMALLFLIYEKHSFGFSSLFVINHFIPRNFTIPLVIYAVYLYITKRKIFGYALLGVVANLHILSIVPVILSFVLNDIINLYRVKVKNINTFLFSLGVFIVAALPLLVKFYDHFSIHLEETNINIIYQDFYNAVLTPILQITNTDGWIMFVNSILIILFSYICILKFKGLNLDAENISLFKVILIVGGILVFASLIFERVLVNPFLLQLQLGRSSEFSILIFITLLSYILNKIFILKRNKVMVVFGVIIGTLFSNIAFLLPIFTTLRPKKLSKIGFVVTVVSLTILYISVNKYITYFTNVNPSVAMNIQQSDNVEVQLWLKNNTKTDTVILSPYYIGGFTEPDFRTISERHNVLTNADIVETILNKNLLMSTIAKIDDLTINNYMYLKYDDRLFNYYVDRELYHKATIENFEYIKNKYNVDYIVFESEFTLPHANLVYENSKYKIYSII